MDLHSTVARVEAKTLWKWMSVCCFPLFISYQGSYFQGGVVSLQLSLSPNTPYIIIYVDREPRY